MFRSTYTFIQIRYNFKTRYSFNIQKQLMETSKSLKSNWRKSIIYGKLFLIRTIIPMEPTYSNPNKLKKYDHHSSPFHHGPKDECIRKSNFQSARPATVPDERKPFPRCTWSSRQTKARRWTRPTSAGDASPAPSRSRVVLSKRVSCPNHHLILLTFSAITSFLFLFISVYFRFSFQRDWLK